MANKLDEILFGSWRRQYLPGDGHEVCNCKPPQKIWREGSSCDWGDCRVRKCSRCLRCLSDTLYIWTGEKVERKAKSPLADVCGCGGTRRKQETLL